jgi:hypothetical protein
MADLKFISLFNDIVINIMHIRWCEKIRKHYCGEEETFGIYGVNQLYSDMMTFSDCDCPCKASEYEEVITINYKPKKV